MKWVVSMMHKRVKASGGLRAMVAVAAMGTALFAGAQVRGAGATTAESGVTTAPASGDAASGDMAGREMSADMDEAVNRGLSFLAKSQNSDGSIDGGGPTVATTGLSVMAMLASGQVADEGRLGVTVRTAVDFLTRAVPDDGYVGKVDGSRMYGQGIVTLALAEAIGVETDQVRLKRMRAALERLVGVIERAQDVTKDAAHAGGWQYDPQSTDSDLSVTAWCVLGLRAAGNVGIEMDKTRVDRAAGFVMSCYRPAQGGFADQVGADASVSMTGAGVLSLMLLDRGGSDAVTAGARYVIEHSTADTTEMPYDAIYYATTAAYQVGGSTQIIPAGRDSTWSTVWSRTSARLMAMRGKDGGWPASPGGEEPGRVYATAMATLTLSVPYRVAPTNQR